jgi:hypothetical protein
MHRVENKLGLEKTVLGILKKTVVRMGIEEKN